MKYLASVFFSIIIAASFIACDSDPDYKLPDIRQDMCMLTWHGTNKGASFVTDAGRKYNISTKVNFTSLKPDSAYRMIVSYIPNADSVSAELYDQPMYVYILPDSSCNAIKCDTINKFNNVWMGGGYLNLSMRFKHDGSSIAKQVFAYRVDSVKQRGENGRQYAKSEVSLFFLQNKVQPLAYMNIICSLDPKHLGLAEGDTLELNAVSQMSDYLKKNTFILGR